MLEICNIRLASQSQPDLGKRLSALHQNPFAEGTF